MAAALLLILASGLAGYWAARGKQGGSPVAVEATEEALTAPDGDRGRSMAPARAAPGSIWNIIPEYSQDTKNAANALGDPDDRVAVVMPGGTLALAYAAGDYFYNGAAGDLRIHGPTGDKVPYTIFVKETQEQKWMRVDVNRNGFPRGVASHDFGHHGVERAAQVMIRNDGTINLYIDAIIPLHTQPETRGKPEEHHK